MVQEQGAAGGGGGGGKKRNRNRNKNKNKGNNNGGGKSNSQSHDDTPPPQETRQREEQVAEEEAKVAPREVTPPVETRKSQEPQNHNQQLQQNGGLVQDEAGLAKNLARDYMPPANWLELREAEKAFYERLAKGGANKVLIGTADVDLWLTQYRSTLIVQSKLFPSKNLLLSLCNAVRRIRPRRREGVGLRH